MLKNKSTSSYKLLDSANGLLKVRPSPKNCVARSGLEEERSDGRRPDLAESTRSSALVQNDDKIMEKPPKNENTPEKSEAVHERIDELRIDAPKRLGEEFNEIMLDFATKLEKRRPDCR